MATHLEKPWLPLTSASIAELPAQLGVYEIADEAGSVLSIGYAGGREVFGMRSALERELKDAADSPVRFRVELTHGYLTRWTELLMIHKATFGSLPIANSSADPGIGRLSP